jgi:hypothetical protein
VFIKKSMNRFCIILVYVDDLNIIGTTEDIKEAMAYLNSKFEMEDLGKTSFAWACISSTPLPKGVYAPVWLYQKGPW